MSRCGTGMCAARSSWRPVDDWPLDLRCPRGLRRHGHAAPGSGADPRHAAAARGGSGRRDGLLRQRQLLSDLSPREGPDRRRAHTLRDRRFRPGHPAAARMAGELDLLAPRDARTCGGPHRHLGRHAGIRNVRHRADRGQSRGLRPAAQADGAASATSASRSSATTWVDPSPMPTRPSSRTE